MTRRSPAAVVTPDDLRPIVRVTRQGAGWEIRVSRLLRNFNSGWGGGNRSGHWATRNRERRVWLALLTTGFVDALGLRGACAVLGPKSGLPGAVGRCTERRQVHITRAVPTKRQFIRDEFDNLRWATKELRDVLTQLALIRDDSSRWCETTIDQAVSPDGRGWTLLTIAPGATEEAG